MEKSTRIVHIFVHCIETYFHPDYNIIIFQVYLTVKRYLLKTVYNY